MPKGNLSLAKNDTGVPGGLPCCIGRRREGTGRHPKKNDLHSIRCVS
jgi:hypothetical protein